MTKINDFSNFDYPNEAKDVCKELKTNPQFQPGNMDIDNFKYYFCNYINEDCTPYMRLSPLHCQNGTLDFYSEDGTESNGVSPDYFHILPFSSNGYDCRLYLNIKADNILKVASKFIESLEYEKGLYFKFFSHDNRYETMVVYTSYKDVDNVIKMIDKVKTKNPKLFEGCEKTGAILALINGYIGFGEEPKYTEDTSFNQERSNVLTEYRNRLMDKFWRGVGNYTGNVIIRNASKSLNLEEYLTYRVLLELKRDNKLSNTSIMNMSPRAKNVITQCVKTYINRMQEGNSPNDFDYNGTVNIDGYKFRFNDENIANKLISVFGIKHDENLLRQVCKKYHVSYEHPCLNTETIEELQSVNCNKNKKIKL